MKKVKSELNSPPSLPGRGKRPPPARIQTPAKSFHATKTVSTPATTIEASPDSQRKKSCSKSPKSPSKSLRSSQTRLKLHEVRPLEIEFSEVRSASKPLEPRGISDESLLASFLGFGSFFRRFDRTIKSKIVLKTRILSNFAMYLELFRLLLESKHDSQLSTQINALSTILLFVKEVQQIKGEVVPIGVFDQAVYQNLFVVYRLVEGVIFGSDR